MIEPVVNKKFVNREYIGQYVPIQFDTYRELPGGKQEIVTVSAKVHYYEEGKGEPVVLLHDVGQSLYNYRKLFHALAENYRVIAVDLLGHGYSDAPDMFYTIEENTMALGAFLSALSIERANFIACGQSYGEVLNFSLFNKDNAGDLVFISPGCFAGTKQPRAGFVAAKLTKRAYLNRFLDKCFFDKTLLNDEYMEEVFLHLQNPGQKSVLKCYTSNFTPWELWEKARALTNRVLIISSEDDPLTDRGEVAEFSSVFSNAFMMSIRNCGHYPQEEKPARVLEAVLQFLAEGDRPGEEGGGK